MAAHDKAAEESPQLGIENILNAYQNRPAPAEQESLHLDEEETELNPVKSIDLVSGNEVMEIAEITAEDV